MYQTILKPSFKNKISVFIVLLILLGLKSRRCNVNVFLSCKFSLSVLSLCAFFTGEYQFNFWKILSLSYYIHFSADLHFWINVLHQHLFSDLSIWTNTCVFSIKFFLAKVASLSFPTVFLNTFSGRSLGKMYFEYFFPHCSSILLNYLHATLNSFLTNDAQQSIILFFFFSFF